MTEKVSSGKTQNYTNKPQTKVEKKKKEIDIAKAMMQYAADNNAAIGKEGFQSLLKKVNKNNIIDIIKRYNEISPKESIINMILSETGSSDKEMESALTGKGNGKTAIRGLFTLLCDKAKEVGVDSTTISNFEKEFNEELDKQLGKEGFFSQMRSLISINSTRLDIIMNTLVQTIDNQTFLTQTEKETISTTPATKLQADTNSLISRRYNQALKDFKEQLAKDGWAADVADAMGRIWGDNFADAVLDDLKICRKQYDELVEAKKKGSEAYKAKFKEIFGVAYNPTNIEVYRKAEARYIEASKAKAQEDNYNSQLSVLLNSNKLQEEGTNVISPTTGVGHYIKTATKQQVYDREYKRFADLLGPEGDTIIKTKFEQAGVTNKSIDEKFKVLQILAKVGSTNLHNQTMLTTGGVSYETIEKQKDNCYKAAFGLENDIMKRVTDYNISQQKGAGIVKGVTVMTIVTACALTGQVEGIVALSAVAAGSTAAVETTDAATQKRNLDVLKKDGLGAYLKSVGKNTDWGSIAKASLTSGAMMLAIGGVSYPIANLCRISASAAGLTGKSLDIATGLGTNAVVTGGVLGTQYLVKGEITTEDAVFAIIMAVVGSTIQVIQINKAYAMAENAAIDAYKQDILNHRRTLGFEDGVEITPEMLTQQYRKIVLRNHPDKGGQIDMAVIKSAKEFLQAHMSDINIGITGAKPQTINPTVEAAKGNTTAQNSSAKDLGLIRIPQNSESSKNAVVTRQNLLELKNNGYNVTSTHQNQIIAYSPDGRAIEVGTLGKTPLVDVTNKLNTIAPKTSNTAELVKTNVSEGENTGVNVGVNAGGNVAQATKTSAETQTRIQDKLATVKSREEYVIIRKELEAKVSSQKTEKGKFNEIFKYMQDNKDKFENLYDPNQGYCANVSQMFKLLCDDLGITGVEYKQGYYTNPGGIKSEHAWNEVTINGETFIYDVAQNTMFTKAWMENPKFGQGHYEAEVLNPQATKGQKVSSISEENDLNILYKDDIDWKDELLKELESVKLKRETDDINSIATRILEYRFGLTGLKIEEVKQNPYWYIDMGLTIKEINRAEVDAFCIINEKNKIQIPGTNRKMYIPNNIQDKIKNVDLNNLGSRLEGYCKELIMSDAMFIQAMAIKIGMNKDVVKNTDTEALFQYLKKLYKENNSQFKDLYGSTTGGIDGYLEKFFDRGSSIDIIDKPTLRDENGDKVVHELNKNLVEKLEAQEEFKNAWLEFCKENDMAKEYLKLAEGHYQYYQEKVGKNAKMEIENFSHLIFRAIQRDCLIDYRLSFDIDNEVTSFLDKIIAFSGYTYDEITKMDTKNNLYKYIVRNERGIVEGIKFDNGIILTIQSAKNSPYKFHTLEYPFRGEEWAKKAIYIPHHSD